jgi:hypothetical protein
MYQIYSFELIGTRQGGVRKCKGRLVMRRPLIHILGLVAFTYLVVGVQ